MSSFLSIPSLDLLSLFSARSRLNFYDITKTIQHQGPLTARSELLEFLQAAGGIRVGALFGLENNGKGFLAITLALRIARYSMSGHGGLRSDPFCSMVSITCHSWIVYWQ